MENLNLASLPNSILHQILSQVATNSIRDFGSARVAFRGFNEISREDYFYKSANIFIMNECIEEVNTVRTIKIRCYHSGNPEAIYLRGMYEFFMLHFVHEGMEKVHLASERGCLLGEYVDGMMNSTFSVNDRGLVHNYPSFTREHVDQMFHIITSPEISGHWDYDIPGMFCSAMERIDHNVLYTCWCSGIEEPLSVNCIDGSIPGWLCDHCFWQSAAWKFCSKIYLIAREWSIGD